MLFQPFSLCRGLLDMEFLKFLYKSKFNEEMIRNYLKLCLFVAFAVSVVSCNSSMNNQDEQKLIENEQAIEKYAADSNITLTRDTSGLYYSLTPNPMGTKVALGEEAIVKYNAYLLNGTKIWSSEKDTVKYARYPFGTGYNFVLFGMERAVFLMRVGEKAKLFIPFHLGFYGINRMLTGFSTNASIPEYSVIKVDIELVGKRSEVQQINEFIESKKLTVGERSADNLVLADMSTVAGDTIGAGKAVRIKYVGKSLDGTVFDPGTQPLSYTTGTSGVIKGFDRAIRKLKVGQKATIVLPSALAYGKDGVINSDGSNFSIRPYQPISFEVEILD